MQMIVETIGDTIMKVLVVGGGGREHAIVEKVKESKRVDEILAEAGCKDASEYLAKLESGEVPDPIPNRAVPEEA